MTNSLSKMVDPTPPYSVLSVTRCDIFDEDYQEGHANSWVTVDKLMLHDVDGELCMDYTPVFVPLPCTMWKGDREVTLTDDIIDTLCGKIAINMVCNDDAVTAKKAKLRDFLPPQDELSELLAPL